MNSITEWMVENKIAENGFAAGHIAAGLQITSKLPRAEQEARCILYRKWKPKTDKASKELKSSEAYDLAIAGIDPDNVPARQIELFDEVIE
jgi:hypothetical protein